jgi:hypothetical protein
VDDVVLNLVGIPRPPNGGPSHRRHISQSNSSPQLVVLQGELLELAFDGLDLGSNVTLFRFELDKFGVRRVGVLAELGMILVNFLLQVSNARQDSLALSVKQRCNARGR